MNIPKERRLIHCSSARPSGRLASATAVAEPVRGDSSSRNCGMPGSMPMESESAADGQNMRLLWEEFLQQAHGTPGWNSQRSAAAVSSVLPETGKIPLEGRSTQRPGIAAAPGTMPVVQSFEVAPTTSPLVQSSGRRAFQ
jgi:hypothetical protein